MPEIKLDIDFYYGTWVMKFQNFLLYYLPYKFNIDFQVWAMNVGSVFLSMIVTSFIYLYSKFVDEKNGLFCSLLMYLISFFLFFILHYNLGAVDLLLYSGFFRFVFPSFLLLLFLSSLFQFFYQQKISIFWLIFLSFIASASSELVAQIIISVSFLTLFYVFVKFRNEVSSYRQNIPYICILVFSILGFLSLFFSAGFQQHINSKAVVKFLIIFFSIF